MSEAEALEYLKIRDIDNKEAAQIFKLVGGRMIHLKQVVDRIKEKETFEGMYTVC